MDTSPTSDFDVKAKMTRRPPVATKSMSTATYVRRMLSLIVKGAEFDLFPRKGCEFVLSRRLICL